ncbi:MAG: LysM peptidoglycan-binding domain-containing protein [Candidatus Brocadiaceae bacterium]|nr:LysM peptidoglycan-binding domain-containing protein [Candidatus Brocadiaceae bacterium]
MKRDVQVGVTLGVIIMAIIGVFLSTRTAVKEPAIPIPEMEEETQGNVVDINELSPEPQNVNQESFKKVTAKEQQPKQKQSSVSDTAKIDEQTKENEDRVIEVEWKKAKEAKPLPTTKNDEKLADMSNTEDWKDISSDDNKKIGAKATTYKVKINDSLRKIASKYYGDESKWLLILNANQDKIPDRNSLRIGTELFIPEEKLVSKTTKTGIKTETTTPSLSQLVNVDEVQPAESAVKKHTVLHGDTLYTLAVKYYHDGAKWEKIFNANKKNLKDKKSLKIGQELIIPNI